MLFHEPSFLLFFAIALAVYWLVLDRWPLAQNLFVVLASYVFYGWWSKRYVVLIVISSLADYTIGLLLAKTSDITKRRLLLVTSLVVNLGLLGVFKYYDFFATSFSAALSSVGFSVEPKLLRLILPVGISFYTFQTLSYTIDVYRGKISPCQNIITFFAFVSFFPQLVAGPIERASSLIPQFERPRFFRSRRAYHATYQIAWGFFKKIVIADTCALSVNWIFSNSNELSWEVLCLGAVFFAFQIYGDFSGYSDIAIGVARLFGFELMTNFRTPYFSRDIAEFWRRWHISLSTWFRDYVYIPLGGSRAKMLLAVRNISIVFLVSGLWHGANWTFVIWGALNALFFLPLFVFGMNRRDSVNNSRRQLLPTSIELVQILVTFALTCFAWIFFRADNIGEALNYVERIITLQPTLIDVEWHLLFVPIVLIVPFVCWEWRFKHCDHQLPLLAMPRWKRHVVMLVVVSLITSCWTGTQNGFIYFQF